MRLLPIIVFPLLWAVLWWPVLTAQHILFARDISVFTQPAKAYLIDRLSVGELPFWTPFIGMGMPFLADVSNQVFYPLNILIGLAPSIEVGVSWFLIVHSLLSMGAMWVLCRALRIDAFTAVWTGCVYALAGYNLSIVDNLTYLPATVWVPLGLAALRRGLDTQHYRYAGLLGLAWAPLLLAGDVQGLGLSAVLAGLMVTQALWQQRFDREFFIRASLLLVGGLALVALICAVQLLPTLDLLAWSKRSVGLSAEEHLSFSFPPVRLAELIQPFAFGSLYPQRELHADLYLDPGDPWVNSVYIGLIPIIFVLYALWRRVPGIGPWVLFAVGSAILAFGQHTALGPWLAELPVFGGVRYPEKYLFGTTLALVVIAGLGFTRLRTEAEPRLRLPVVAIAYALVGASLWAAVSTWGESRPTSILWMEKTGWTDQTWWVLVGHSVLMVGVVLSWLVVRSSLRRRMLNIVAWIAVLDLVWVHLNVFPTAPTALFAFAETPTVMRELATEGMPAGRVHYDYLSPRIERVVATGPAWQHLHKHVVDPQQDPRSVNRFDQLLKRERGMPNTAARHGLRYFNAQTSPLQPRFGFERETLWLRRYPISVLRLFGVRYVVTAIGPHNPSYDDQGVRQISRRDDLNLRILEVIQPAPEVYLARTAREDWPLEVFLADNDADPNLYRETIAIVNPSGTSPRPQGADSGNRQPVGSVQWERMGAERFSIQTEALEPSYLVINETYLPGWTAELDGKAVPVHMAQYGVMAVPIAAGPHHVNLQYQPRRWTLGIALSVLGLLTALVLFLTRPPASSPASS